MEKLRLLLTILCLISAPSHTIKIGISHSYNNTATATATPPTTVEPATTITPAVPAVPAVSAVSYMTESSVSPLPELATSTPSQTFPPRPQPKPSATAAPTQASTTAAQAEAEAAATAEAQPLNATETTPKIPMNFPDDSFYFCSCDLRSEMCDLNCCCDRDCPTETRQVFSCLKVLAAPQLLSRLEDFQYTHGLPTCQINDGWLCVFRSNTKPAKMKPLIRNFDASQYQKWPDPLGAYETEAIGPPAPSTLYKSGEPLQLWHPESRQSTTFDLPTAYEGSQCHLKQLIRHLQPLASNCRMRDEAQLQESVWALLNLTASHQLLPKPRDLEEQQVEAVQIQVCQQLDSGRVLCAEPGNDTQWAGDMPVERLELQLIHNFTNILAAKLLIKEAAAAEDDTEPIWLHYAVTFATANESLAKPSSGPLGYLAGAPVILSRMLPQNSSEEQQLLSYFHARNDDPDYHWLPLFSRKPRSGNCQRKLDETQVLRFGVDLAQQCLLHQAAPQAPQENANANANQTEFCQRLQAEIWRKLLPHNCSSLEEMNQVFVSQLGRPQPERWIPIQLHFGENAHDVPPVLGYYDEAQQSLSCRNMFLSVSYEFHVADLALLEGRVPHQSVLQHARLVLGQRHDLEFDGSEQLVELPLGVSAMFYNLEKSRPNGAATLIAHRIVVALMLLLWLALKDIQSTSLAMREYLI
ncbi:tectonic [Drosophila obscura]|uniref:tectonic n=1 Tax=Drosophila obscura TaxID=7282 RepID=UPI001BB14BE0|nr:tectonic [Drosophila obscura]